MNFFSSSRGTHHMKALGNICIEELGLRAGLVVCGLQFGFWDKVVSKTAKENIGIGLAYRNFVMYRHIVE